MDSFINLWQSSYLLTTLLKLFSQKKSINLPTDKPKFLFSFSFPVLPQHLSFVDHLLYPGNFSFLHPHLTHFSMLLALLFSRTHVNSMLHFLLQKLFVGLPLSKLKFKNVNVSKNLNEWINACTCT